MTNKIMWRGIGALLLMLLLLSSNVCAQTDTLLYPLKNVPLLSGNFGELRATHLHTGLDFKTGGREGLPVICVKDGVVARVKVSATGYGNALYLEHEGGITTVYGHLSRFVPRITKVVRNIQYNKESFEVDENMSGYELRFRAGDTIAYSGNTGSSGGPHLHFEVRDTKSERALNPLRFLSVKDQTGPSVRGVYVYSISNEGARNAARRVEVKNTGNRVFRGGKVGVPAGMVGIGIQSDDYMKDSWNKLGVYDLSVGTNGQEVFKMTMNELSFDQTFLVNELKDFHHYRENRLVYLTFGNYQEQLLSVSNQNGGFIPVEKDSVVDVTVDLSDINGNRSRIVFQLWGKSPLRKLVLADGEKLLTNHQNDSLRKGKYTLWLEADALSYPIVCKPEVSSRLRDSVETIEVFSTGKQIYPLMKNARLVVGGKFPEKSVICLLEKNNRFSALKTQWTEEGLEAFPRLLGEYTVRQDTIAPVIFYTGRAGQKIRFRMVDDLSGISSYRVEVNGKWCLFAYDAKNRLLEGNINEPVFVKGKNRLVLKVEDAVKNIATFETDIYKK
ncbi:MAG: M23 family metallopeptidase [Bacteroidales bacterium]|nr:M23 family metallopeptidase [Bacteroidales bacterium]